MTIEQQVLEKLRDLSPEKQQEVLDFVDFLKEKDGGPKKPRRSLRGLSADLNVHITEEDIAEARREMWGNFSPRHQTMSAALDTHTVFGKLKRIVSGCPGHD
jgi:Protein of unknown function (DUF2281)